MKFRFLFSIIIILLFRVQSTGQTEQNLGISNSTIVSVSGEMPLWLWANRDGKILTENTLLNLSELNGELTYYFNDAKAFFKAGTTLAGGIGNKKSYFQGNALFAALNLNNWELDAGLYYRDEMFAGLSTTNGNLAQSRNARPHPAIRLRVAEYKPIPLIGKYFFFKGEYEEGLLNDERYVDHAHLHHKSLYIKLQPVQSFDLQVGLEHFVMWGGTSQNPNIGKLPSNFDAYIQYVMGKSGDEQFPGTDQHNIAGNHYGTYQVLITHKTGKREISLNFSHPFDDLSGMNFRNWKDNLIGLNIKFNDPKKLITNFIYEFVHTKNQGVDSIYRWNAETQKWNTIDYDNYFNNGIYRSGATYQKMAMGSPIFFPVMIDRGISAGFRSNRFFAHHIGLKGTFLQDFNWKGMLTYMQHSGTWGNPYPKDKIQASGLLEVHYHGKKLPFEASVVFAGDVIKTEKDNLGLRLSVSKKW